MLAAVDYPGFLSFEVPPFAWGATRPRDAVRDLSAGLRFLREIVHNL
jgi:hypothetical protein